jgi:hypothetical protein
MSEQEIPLSKQDQLALAIAQGEFIIGWARQNVDGQTAEMIDEMSWDWYAETCPCGQPPGECRTHPRGRLSQQPPAGQRVLRGHLHPWRNA